MNGDPLVTRLIPKNTEYCIVYLLRSTFRLLSQAKRKRKAPNLS